MSSVAGTSLRPGIAVPRAHVPELSLFRLYTLRVSYLILAAGLGTFIWPTVIHHTNEFAVSEGVRFSLLAGLGAIAALGLRYPVQMIPLLLFELIWKAIYLSAFAFPMWSAHRMTAAMAEDVQACSLAVIFIPLIPWRYVFARYIRQRGDRWT